MRPRPAARFGSRQAAAVSGVERLRACSAKAADAAKYRGQSHPNQQLEAAPSPANVLAAQPFAPQSKQQPAAAPSNEGAFVDMYECVGALYSCLDSLAGAIAGRRAAVPSAAGDVLRRLFPLATSISVTLRSSDGQGIAVTTLLHSESESEAADVPGVHHAEPFPGGLCSFHLAQPPTPSMLRLMRAFLNKLTTALRLELESTAASVAAHLDEAMPAAPSTPGSQDAFAAPSSRGLPADCFWMSV